MLQTHIQTRAYKNRQRKHEAWLSFIQTEISMSTYLVILGVPPGRALFNVKSWTLRALTMVSCWWRLNVVTMAIPLIFFLFFIESKMQELTPIRRQDMDWERTYFGVLTYLPHTCTCTWCWIQNKRWKQNNGSAGFKNQGAPKIYLN